MAVTGGFSAEFGPLIAALTRRLHALGDMELPPPAKGVVVAALADLTAFCDAQAITPEPFVDQPTFDALLALAGPQICHDLLRQLADDLSAVASRLTPALGTGDRAEVRAETHILLALAGSVGATRLYQQAERLNHAANSGGDLAQPGPSVLAGLAQLRRFIDDARKPTRPERKA